MDGVAMNGEWKSKGPGNRKGDIHTSGSSAYVVRPGNQSQTTAHFIVDGASLCSKATMKKTGEPLLAAFLCSWVEFRHFDRRCRICRRMLLQIGRR
jgi:hypothetical protein